MTAALDRLLSIEVEATEARRLAGRLRFACLPTPASLEDFDYDAAAGVDRKVIEELATCRYLETATNVLLIGPPRVGKTHLSVGLARAAAHADIAPTSPPRPTSWGEVLGDNTVDSAMLDRLLHRSVVLNLDGDSYRLRDHNARAEKLRRTTTGTRQPLQ
jgi:DNA replication protein DnaC